MKTFASKSKKIVKNIFHPKIEKKKKNVATVRSPPPTLMWYGEKKGMGMGEGESCGSGRERKREGERNCGSLREMDRP